MIRRKLNYFSIAVVVLLFLILIKDLYQSDFLITITRIIKPFVYGFVIAYVLNPIIHYGEKKTNISKPAVIALTYTVLILFLAVFFTKVSPSLILSIRNLTLDLPGSIDILLESIELNFLSRFNSETLNQLYSAFILWLNSILYDNISGPSFDIEQVFSITRVVAGILMNIIIGVVISIYMIKDKVKFALLGKKLLYAFLEKDEATSIINFLTDLHRVFSRFLMGKIIDSGIMGLLCFIALSIIGAPLILLVTIIFAVTNIVPYFGPLVGMVIIGLISVVYMPEQAVAVIITVVLLQQFDGLYLGPKILGGKVGLSAFWTMTTILLSGGFFGIFGMLLAVPAASVLRVILNKTVEERLDNKNIKLE